MGKLKLIFSSVIALGLLAAAIVYRAPGDAEKAVGQPAAGQPPLRIALVPEYDVLELRKSYRGLVNYLSPRLGRKVEIVTLNSYSAVLKEFQDKKIEGAFLGSLIAVMTMDRCDTRPIVRPETDGDSMYRGVIFVRADSPVKSLNDMAGRSIAVLKATTAGSLFPLSEMHRRGLLPLQPDDPHLVWMGTHDDVIAAVVSGRAEIGAVKDLRLNAWLKANPDTRIRRLATSPAVPNNALMLRKDIAEEIGKKLSAVLLGMKDDPEARAALGNLRIDRFIPCDADAFRSVYDMVDGAGEAWELAGIPGPAPRRPAP